MFHVDLFYLILRKTCLQFFYIFHLMSLHIIKIEVGNSSFSCYYLGLKSARFAAPVFGIDFNQILSTRGIPAMPLGCWGLVASGWCNLRYTNLTT